MHLEKVMSGYSTKQKCLYQNGSVLKLRFESTLLLHCNQNTHLSWGPLSGMKRLHLLIFVHMCCCSCLDVFRQHPSVVEDRDNDQDPLVVAQLHLALAFLSSTFEFSFLLQHRHHLHFDFSASHQSLRYGKYVDLTAGIGICPGPWIRSCMLHLGSAVLFSFRLLYHWIRLYTHYNSIAAIWTEADCPQLEAACTALPTVLGDWAFTI